MRFKHVGVSSLRIFTATRLRAMDSPTIICDHSEPIAAMVPYEMYLKWQQGLKVAASPAQTAKEE